MYIYLFVAPTLCTEEPRRVSLYIVQEACMMATKTSAAIHATTTYSLMFGSTISGSTDVSETTLSPKQHQK